MSEYRSTDPIPAKQSVLPINRNPLSPTRTFGRYKINPTMTILSQGWITAGGLNIRGTVGLDTQKLGVRAMDKIRKAAKRGRCITAEIVGKKMVVAVVRPERSRKSYRGNIVLRHPIPITA